MTADLVCFMQSLQVYLLLRSAGDANAYAYASARTTDRQAHKGSILAIASATLQFLDPSCAAAARASPSTAFSWSGRS